MSIKINIGNLSMKQKQKIDSDLTIKLKDNFGGKNNIGNAETIYPYTIVENDIILPFNYTKRTLKLPSSIISFPPVDIKFTAKLRKKQEKVKKEAITYLNKYNSIIISAHTGFGKSITAIKLCSKISLKTLIIIPNKSVLITQWKESFERFCDNLDCQIIKTNSKIRDCPVYIINGMIMPKIPLSFYKNIGCVVVDEAHLMMSKKMYKSLEMVQPKYLIGLTATPYRPDSLDILLKLYFGKDVIYRKLNQPHIVHMIRTNFSPKIQKTPQGRLDWNAILQSQAEDENRNEMLASIAKKFQDRIILILCKRLPQIDILYEKLKDTEHVTTMIGKNKNYDKNARILICTFQKGGVGFDHPSLDMIILGGDVEEYYIQYIGRCFRREDVMPIIIDPVDDNKTLEKHWLTRKKVYLEHGGKIEPIKL